MASQDALRKTAAQSTRAGCEPGTDVDYGSQEEEKEGFEGSLEPSHKRHDVTKGGAKGLDQAEDGDVKERSVGRG